MTSRNTLICNVFTDNINQETEADIIEALILIMRGTMLNSNKFEYDDIEYASIKYIGTDDYIMKKVSIKLSVSLKNFLKNLILLVKNHIIVY